MGRQKVQLPLLRSWGTLEDEGDHVTLSEKRMCRVWRFDPEGELPGAGGLPVGQQPCWSPSNTAAKGAAGKVTSSTNPGSSGHGLLWKYLCVRCFIFFLLEWESKSLICVPLFQDQDEKLWSSMPRTFSECWVKGKLFCVQTQCTWASRSRIPHAEVAVFLECVRGCVSQNPARADTAFTVNLQVPSEGSFTDWFSKDSKRHPRLEGLLLAT